MLFADTMAIFFVILGLLLAFTSLWLLCRALWTEQVMRSSEMVGLKSFFIGIPITAIAVVIVIVVGKLPASFGQIGGVLTFSALFLYAQIGVSGLATQIGNRLPSPADKDKAWRPTLRGSIILALSWLLPLVGWFLIIPVSVIHGAGATTRSLFPKKKGAKKSRGAQTLLSVDSAPGGIVDDVANPALSHAAESPLSNESTPVVLLPNTAEREESSGAAL